jgi:peptidoglycan biosynthesis protein MviN/MurJ (putative lipid II flippase)
VLLNIAMIGSHAPLWIASEIPVTALACGVLAGGTRSSAARAALRRADFISCGTFPARS